MSATTDYIFVCLHSVEVDRLEAMGEAATPAPWVACCDSHAPDNGKTRSWIETHDILLLDALNGNPRNWEDVRLLVELRNKLPSIVTMLRAHISLLGDIAMLRASGRAGTANLTVEFIHE